MPDFTCHGQSVYDIKSNQYTDKKYTYIKRKIVFSENAGVGIKQDRDRKCTGQYACGKCRIDTRKGIFEPAPCKQGVDQHWKIAQFHVFPGRFTDGKKESDNPILPGPSVDEVCKCSGDEDK